jgi:hypothetical protein
MALTACPVVGKRKSAEICAAFIAGAPRKAEGRVFYGITETNREAWVEARRDSAPYFYIDNAYFDKARGSYFRITLGRVQCTGLGLSDCRRFDALGISIQPWRSTRSRIVLICSQSAEFYVNVLDGGGADWAPSVAALLGESGFVPKVRAWDRDKAKLAATLGADLADACALVTWSSAAAITAVLAGVPIVAGESAAAPMAGSLLELIENRLPRRDDRRQWAGVLADNQWTLAEMRDGTAWRMLSEREAVSA